MIFLLWSLDHKTVLFWCWLLHTTSFELKRRPLISLYMGFYVQGFLAFWLFGGAYLDRAVTDTIQVQMQVEAHYVSDVLRGNDTSEMRITLLRYIEDEMPPDDE